MLKKLIFIFVFISSLYGGKNKIEILANTIESNNTAVTAKDNVLIYYDNSVIKASSVLFHKKKELLTLSGHVEVIGYKGTKEQTNFMQINTKTKEVEFDKLFLMSQNDIWIFANKAKKKEESYELGASMFSSCNIKNPLWKMYFSNALYDTNSSYMKLYNTKLYMWNIPLFYTPYLGFSLKKERTSGVLFPIVGYSKLEGVLYEQPLYWAINPNMDMEFNPQIRTTRSTGIYSTFRFVDSAYSQGKVRLGFFKDKESYALRENLTEDKHYGIEFNYNSSKFLKQWLPYNFKDGLYINSTILNDIDYLNLQKNGLNHFGLNPLQESRINYFSYTNAYYLGLHTKYFIDTRSENNDATLQILPSVQLHKYLTSFLWQNLTYTMDLVVNNFERKKGIKFNEKSLNIPIEWSMGFFDNFMTVSLREEFFYRKVRFFNGEYQNNNYEYFNALHKINFFSDMNKQYNNFMHAIHPSFTYINAGTQRENPVEFSKLTLEQQSLFSIKRPENSYEFSLNHYLYNKNMKLKFYQRISQKIYANRILKWADIDNEMFYYFMNITLYHHFIYSYDFKKFRESSSLLFLDYKQYNFSLGHTYTNSLDKTLTVIDTDDMIFSFVYRLSDVMKIKGGIIYKLTDTTSEQWNIGISYRRDCWGISTSFRQSITPRPNGFTTDTGLYIQMRFAPFGSLGTGEF